MAEPTTTDGDTLNCDLTSQVAENTVEYLLYVIDSKYDARQVLSYLEAVRKEALELCQRLSKNYIWQRDVFDLELKNEGGMMYLRGATDYGDAVEDEWFIVYLLRQLTSSHPSLWARVFDSDGEFLLIEAAKVLPKWLSPEMDHNRVWIHNTKLFIIPHKHGSVATPRNMTLPEAVSFLKNNQSALVHSDLIEAEAFYRLEKYPDAIADSIHHSIVTIPRRLAFILYSLPRSIAGAVEAFYLRDALTLKPILSSTSELEFPPDDLVTVSVRFSKVLFAQLRSQRFQTPPRWQTALKNNNHRADHRQEKDTQQQQQKLENGMKLTCGFEMLAAKAAESKSRTVRELALLIEDMREDGDEVLPSDIEINSWPHADRSDSEAWLDINYQDFERELEGKRGGDTKAAVGKEGFGDTNTQENLRKIVSRFEAFLNDDTAGIDGAELDEMDEDDDDDDDSDNDSDSDSGEEDKEVSFDEEEFSKMMREMMGLADPPSSTPNEPPTTRKTKDATTKEERQTGTSPSEVDQEVEDIKKLTSLMEAELNEHGALRTTKKSNKGEVSNKTIRNEGEIKRKEDDKEEKEQEEEESDGDLDIDYNLAKNILESFKSQGGMAGPTGNLLGLMGLQLPRDEDDGDNDDE